MRRHGIRALAGVGYGPVRPTAVTISPSRPISSSRTSQPRDRKVWLANITYLPTGEGWLYLAAVLDLATRKIVGWSMRDHMRAELSVAALMMAAQRQRPAAGLICHSDRGSQYAAEAYRTTALGMGERPSMSRTGCCYDNAPMESFSTRSRSSSPISDDGRTGMKRGAICSLTSRAITIGRASTRHSAISRPSKPRGQQNDLPVSARTREDQNGLAFTTQSARRNFFRRSEMRIHKIIGAKRLFFVFDAARSLFIWLSREVILVPAASRRRTPTLRFVPGVPIRRESA